MKNLYSGSLRRPTNRFHNCLRIQYDDEPHIKVASYYSAWFFPGKRRTKKILMKKNWLNGWNGYERVPNKTLTSAQVPYLVSFFIQDFYTVRPTPYLLTAFWVIWDCILVIITVSLSLSTSSSYDIHTHTHPVSFIIWCLQTLNTLSLPRFLLIVLP